MRHSWKHLAWVVGLLVATATQAQTVTVDRVGQVSVKKSDGETKGVGAVSVEDPRLPGVVCYLPIGMNNALVCSSHEPVVLPEGFPSRELLDTAQGNQKVRGLSLVRIIDRKHRNVVYMTYQEIPRSLNTSHNGKTEVALAVVPYAH